MDPWSDRDVISSRRNPLVRRLRQLGTRQGRLDEGRLLLEGTHLLQELLAIASEAIELVATETWLNSHQDLLSRLPSLSVVQPVSDEVLKAALTTVSPDGVAAVVSLDVLPDCDGDVDFWLVLDRLQDPGNLGSLLRTALAADVQTVLLASGADPLSPKVLRASAGAMLRLPHRRFGPAEQDGIDQLVPELKALAAAGVQVVATLVPEAQGPLRPIPYWELDWTKPTALVLGTEGSGLHPSLQACCSHAVTLPHSSNVESLNVAAASVPLLLERRRATMTATSQ
ncbi:MAG: TrmH family RNA methyltransferase [Synechococcus sp.]